MSREQIAVTLKRLRAESGLTADEVGRIIGKSGKTVNAWENNRGQPDAEILIKLCDIYKVDNILKEFSGSSDDNVFTLSDHEQTLILAYRDNKDMQPAVDRLLKIENKSIIKIYARNGKYKTLTVTGDEAEKILEQINQMPEE